MHYLCLEQTMRLASNTAQYWLGERATATIRRVDRGNDLLKPHLAHNGVTQ